MGLKEKITDFTNKATDALISARTTYEKSCFEIECFSLKDVRQNTSLYGIVNYKERTVEFSGVLEEECLNVKKPWFFVTPEGNIFDIDMNSLKQDVVEVQLKSKKENHIITKAKLTERVLNLSKK